MGESSTIPTDAQTTFSAQMKEGCWDLHQAAETADLPKRLVQGQTSRDEFASLVGQSLLLMQRLDDAIVRHRGDVAALGIVADEQLQAPHLTADLRDLGGDPDTLTAFPATQAAIDMVDQADREDPLRLLGLHYVREGANNGNRFIAMKIRGPLGIEGNAGVRHLDPYGEAQRETWEAFKAKWDALPLDAGERQRVLDAGRDMFKAITALHRGITEHAAAN